MKSRLFIWRKFSFQFFFYLIVKSNYYTIIKSNYTKLNIFRSEIQFHICISFYQYVNLQNAFFLFVSSVCMYVFINNKKKIERRKIYFILLYLPLVHAALRISTRYIQKRTQWNSVLFFKIVEIGIDLCEYVTDRVVFFFFLTFCFIWNKNLKNVIKNTYCFWWRWRSWAPFRIAGRCCAGLLAQWDRPCVRRWHVRPCLDPLGCLRGRSWGLHLWLRLGLRLLPPEIVRLVVQPAQTPTAKNSSKWIKKGANVNNGMRNYAADVQFVCRDGSGSRFDITPRDRSFLIDSLLP